MAGKSKKKKKKSAFSRAMSSIFPCKGDGILESLRKIVFLLSVTVFAVCAYLVFDYFYENYVNRELYDGLASGYGNVEVKEPVEDDEQEIIVDEGPKMLPGAEYLLSINPDTIGYIEIPGMDISYPIVQRPTAEEGEYYLHINFMNEEAKAGTIFLDWRNKFTLDEQSDNLVIYGHDMKDGSMFGTLRKYKKDDYVTFYKEHPIIKLSSNYEEADYKIFGVFIADAEIGRGDIFEYYNYIDFNSEDEFYEYVNGVKRRTLILNDVDVEYGDKLIALSTCGQEFTNSRFVVVARKLRDGETVEEGIENSYKNPNPLMPDIWYAIRKNESYDPDAEFIPYG